MSRYHMRISLFFFFNDTATTEIYTLSLHDALPILKRVHAVQRLGELLGHVAVHAVHDRPGGDERGDADEHPEQREAALQFLCADGLEGEPERFEDRHLGGLALIRGDQSVP